MFFPDPVSSLITGCQFRWSNNRMTSIKISNMWALPHMAQPYPSWHIESHSWDADYATVNAPCMPQSAENKSELIPLQALQCLISCLFSGPCLKDVRSPCLIAWFTLYFGCRKQRSLIPVKSLAYVVHPGSISMEI